MKSKPLSAPPTAGEPVAPAYRFLTWNLWAVQPPFLSWVARRPHVFKVLQQQSPDVFGLQEVSRERLRDFDEAFPSYGWVGLPRDEGVASEYNPLFFRKDTLELLWQETLWLSPTPNAPSKGWGGAHPRVVTMAHFRPTAGSSRDFMMMNCHLDHYGLLARRKSVEMLLNLAARFPADLPVALMGDFNFSPKSELYGRIIADQRLADSATIAQQSHDRNRQTWRGLMGSGLGRGRIDYIFTRNMTVKSYQVTRQTRSRAFPSDHYPVSGEFLFR